MCINEQWRSGHDENVEILIFVCQDTSAKKNWSEYVNLIKKFQTMFRAEDINMQTEYRRHGMNRRQKSSHP